MKILRVGAVVVLLAGLVTCAWLFHRRDKPVVWAIWEKGDSSGHPVFVWLNPFRDRSAERVCESALKALRDRDRHGVEVALRGVNGNASLIDHELKNAVKKWSISDIRLQGESAVLYYDAVRVEGDDATPIHIFLKRQGCTWQIVDWEAWY